MGACADGGSPTATRRGWCSQKRCWPASSDLGRAVVLGLPRGGVVVAARVAERLAAPLDVVVVRKIGAPGHAELAMGALRCGEGTTPWCATKK